VTLVRSLTVANVDNDRIRRAQVDPVLGWEVVERQQHVFVVDDLRRRACSNRRVTAQTLTIVFPRAPPALFRGPAMTSPRFAACRRQLGVARV